MATLGSEFDPYYKWLSIPPELQPPDHYCLLGLKLFEDDREVIATAADRQMAHVKTFAVGRYSRESQSLLAELAKAKLCLLNAQKKAVYDARMLAQTTSSEQVATMDATPAKTKAVPVVKQPELCQPSLQVLPTDQKRSLDIKVDAEFSSIKYRSSKRPTSNLVLGWYLLTLTLAIAGFVILWLSRGSEELPPREIAAKPIQPFNRPRPRKPERPIPQIQRNEPERQPNRQPQRQKIPFMPLPDKKQQQVVAAPKIVPQLVNIPKAFDVPEIDETEVKTICLVPPDTELTLLTAEKNLVLSQKRLEWHEDNEKAIIGGLQISNEQLQFRWLTDVPEKAEAALKNSVLLLSLGENRQIVALRQPLFGEDLINFDLTDNKFLIKSPAIYPPPCEMIRFEFLGKDKLPAHSVEGANPSSLAMDDECKIIYEGAHDTSTTITVKRRGNIAVAEFTNIYVLPSGRQIPMSIKKGKAEHKSIQNDLQAVQEAKYSLQQLKQQRPQLQSELDRARKRSVGNMRDQLHAQLIAMDAEMSRLQTMIAAEPNIQADLNEQTVVSELAQRLNQARDLPYRFYMVIEGHEIDLVRHEAAK